MMVKKRSDRTDDYQNEPLVVYEAINDNSHTKTWSADIADVSDEVICLAFVQATADPYMEIVVSPMEETFNIFQYSDSQISQ